MKPSLLLSISPVSAVRRSHLPKGIAALFAAALAMGLGAESALAQGNYYPQVLLFGGAPFTPNGIPVTSNAELNLIEANMPGTATLVIPAVLPNTVATLAEYKTAVQAAAAAVGNGAGGGVTFASLAAEVAKYRQAAPSQVLDGLGAIAAGVIASGSPTKQADLEAVSFHALRVNPAGATASTTFTILDGVFKAAAADPVLASGVGALVNNALLGAVAGTTSSSTAPLGMSYAGVKTIVANGVLAISTAPLTNPATATNALKAALITGLASTVMPSVAGSPSDIDAAASALLNVQVAGLGLPATTGPLTAVIMAAVGAPTDAKLGAIAQGGLRGNPGASAALKSALASAYTNDLIDAYGALTALGANAGILAVSYDPVAVAAAGATRYGANAAVIVKDVLNGSTAGGLLAQDIVTRGVAAAIATPSQNIASAAVGAGTATVADVTTGAIKGALIGSAGAIAKAVIVAPLAGGLTAPNATAIGTAAIGAASAGAYADIAWNLADAVKGAGAPVGVAAVTAVVAAIPTGSGYIGTVAAAAGSLPANRAGILLAGNTADTDATSDAASTAGVGLLASYTANPVTNYYATLASVATPGTDSRNLALLYAASLGNPTDAAGGLAAMIASTTTSPVLLTGAAVSANRSKQTGLTVAADVAVFAKANPTADLQASIGRQILDNPAYVKEIATAATVVIPGFSHYIAHTVAFNNPTGAYDSVATIFLHSKITSTVGTAGVDKLTTGDRPSAVAAIAAGLATGIVESTQLSTGPTGARRAALQSAIRNVMLQMTVPANSYNNQEVFPTFAQSTGGVGTSTLVKAKGQAGAITGFIAQLVQPNVNAIDPDALAALEWASTAVGSTYSLDIAQAAGQAFGWVSGVPTSVAGAAVAAQIASAIFTGYPVVPLASILNAVNFGIDQAKGGEIAANPLRVPGAGANGTRDAAAGDPFYTHSSAQGRPVSNIFSL